MKIKFYLDGNLPLSKTIEVPIVTIVIRTVFLENNKYYLQVFLDECQNKKMIYCDRIDVSEGINVNKTSASNEGDVSHYWYFLNFSFKLQPNVCNICHDLLMISVNLSDFAT